MTNPKRVAHQILLAALLTQVAGTALAQSGPVIPVPFTSVAVGDGNNGGVACSTSVDIPTIAGYHFGDGCPATQATLANDQDSYVDAAGNVYFSEVGSSNHYGIRVLYNGGTQLKNLLTATNAYIPGFTPVIGNVYTLAGGETTTLVSHSAVYYCGNFTTNSILALDSAGDGCPAAEAYVAPRGISGDQFGNIFIAMYPNGTSAKPDVRVIYSGGTQVANLIKLLNPTVTAPQYGYVYAIGGNTTPGTQGDGALANTAGFIFPKSIAVDSSGNIYVADGNSTGTVTASGTVYAIDSSGNNVRMINGTTGIITTVAGESTCSTAPNTYTSADGCPFAAYVAPANPPYFGTLSPGDNGPATSSYLYGPYVVFLDRYNNLFIADTYNARIRVVYRGGTVGGLTNPQVGYIYTYAGGGSTTTTNTLAQNVKFTGFLYGAGIDNAGNIYAYDSGTKFLWKFDALTANGIIFAGDATPTGKGKNCVGTTGPVSTDNYNDGCPSIQAELNGNNGVGKISFDPQGNAYLINTGVSGNNLVQKISFNTQFPATPDGTPVTQPIALQALAATTLTGETFSVDGLATTEFSDIGGDTCTATAVLAAGNVCVFNLQFNPKHAGQRNGSVTFGTSTTTSLTETLGGVGQASDLAVDPGGAKAIGTGITPASVATDLVGNIYASDSAGNRVLKGAAAGTTLTPLITGLSSPSQIAVDGAGNVYVADTGNNRILETTAAGVTIASLGTGLTAPKGVAVDASGNIYASDTGNNRIVVIRANGYQLTLSQASGLSGPTQLALDSTGDLYILDAGNTRVAEYTPGSGISTVTLDAGVIPAGIAVDAAGDLFVEDSSSQIVLVYAPGATAGTELVAGLSTPVGLAADPDTNLFVADSKNTGILEYLRSTASVVFPYTDLGTNNQASISLTNVGNAGLSFLGSPLDTITGNPAFTAAPASGSGCGLGITFAPSTGCNFVGTFAPTVATANQTATMSFNTNAGNAATAVLSGSVSNTATTSTLTVSSPTGSTVYYSQSVTLTATVHPSTTTTTPTGTFTFVVDGRTEIPHALGFGTGATATSVVITLSLPVGSHSVSVAYSGDSTYGGSEAASTFKVNQAVTTTTLTAVPYNNLGQLWLVFTATVSSTTATGETGTVTFYAGTTPIVPAVCPSGISSPGGVSNPAVSSANPATAVGGLAIICTPVLTFTSNQLTAVYSGNANFAGSTSAAVQTNGGDFALGAGDPTLTIVQGQTAPVQVTLESLFGGAGTVTPTCTGLPAYAVCRFLPVFPTVVSGQSQTVSITIYTNVPNNLAMNQKPGISMRGGVMICMLPAGLLLLCVRKRRVLRRLGMLLIATAILPAMTACNQTQLQTYSTLVTPTGTYNVNIVCTGSNGLTTTHSAPVTITVIAD